MVLLFFLVVLGTCCFIRGNMLLYCYITFGAYVASSKLFANESAAMNGARCVTLSTLL